MAGKFNDRNTEYNKSQHFGKFTIDNTTKVTLSEAVARDGGENWVNVFGWVDLPLVGVEKMGSVNWVFEPQLCQFSIPKKSFSKEYNNKKTETIQSPGMKAVLSIIEAHGFDKPFSGRFDFGMPDQIASAIITGKNEAGGELSPAELAAIDSYFCRFTAIEKLEKLDIATIPASSGGGRSYGSSTQKESEKLADRLAFIKAQCAEGSDIEVVLQTIAGLSSSDKRQVLVKLLDRLFV